MDLRLIEVVVPPGGSDGLTELPDDVDPISVWTDVGDGSQRLSRILVKTPDVEAVVDALQSRFGQEDGFRVLISRVEATVPEPEPEPDAPDEPEQPTPQRVSRQELHGLTSVSAELSPTFLTLVVLSTIVAAIGLLRDNVAVIIGAMVIAPWLGPNVALALSTTLADMALAKKSLKTNAVGVAIAFLLSFGVGLIFAPGPSGGEIEARTSVSMSDPVLALASGCAGVLAYTTGAPTSLIGVMVAVALLPPLVVSGLMFATGHYDEGIGASLLVLINVICLNLSGVVTFLAQGIRPQRWWEADRARRASWIAIALWVALLLALVLTLAATSTPK